MAVLSKTVIVGAVVQAQTISSVTGCERFPRQPVEGAVCPVDYLRRRRERRRRRRTDFQLNWLETGQPGVNRMKINVIGVVA